MIDEAIKKKWYIEHQGINLPEEVVALCFLHDKIPSELLAQVRLERDSAVSEELNRRSKLSEQAKKDLADWRETARKKFSKDFCFEITCLDKPFKTTSNDGKWSFENKPMQDIWMPFCENLNLTPLDNFKEKVIEHLTIADMSNWKMNYSHEVGKDNLRFHIVARIKPD
jgi:hypothetical protein